MKKKISTIAAVFISVAFFSCSKEQLQTQSNNETQLAPGTDGISASNRSGIVDPLTVNLEGWFTFDKTLKDKTGKLATATATTRTVLYSADRKGNANSALKLDSTYLVKIFNVVQQTHSSISVWLKYGNVVPFCPFIRSDNDGIIIGQQNLTFTGSVSNSQGTNAAISRDANNGWHHIVVTYDGAFVKLYVDAAYIIPVSHPGNSFSHLNNYIVGAGIDEYWRGYVDELRFYSRTLSAREVEALHNL